MTYSDTNHVDNLEMLVLRMARLMQFAVENDPASSEKSMRTMASQAMDYLNREARGPQCLRSAPMTEPRKETE